MSEKKQEEALTFNALLVQMVEQQLQMAEQDNHTLSFLNEAQRSPLFKTLETVREEDSRRPAFDSTSLKNIRLLFDQAEKYHTLFHNTGHPAHLLFDNPQKWFLQSYHFMHDPVALLELVRYFGGGKTPIEKEIIFRSMVAKLIKTQETKRIICQNQGFLEKYFHENEGFGQKYALYMAKVLNLAEPLAPTDAFIKSLEKLVADIAAKCLMLFEKLKIPLCASAQNAASKGEPYDALILMIRHSGDDLLGNLGNDLYPTLVSCLTTIIQRFHLHPDIYFFQHIKREYLTHWLVFLLRKEDQSKGEAFYQQGKSKIYKLFEPLEVSEEFLSSLQEFENIDEPGVQEAEVEALGKISEDDFYALLLKIYSHYKDDEGFVKNLSMAPQGLASSGNTQWEQRNIIAQAEHKVNKAEDKKGSKLRRLASMVTSLKSASSMFLGVAEKREVVKQKSKTGPPPAPEEAPAPEEKKDVHYRPVLNVTHSGQLLEPFFPIPYYEVSDPMDNQKQDLSINDNDKDMGISESTVDVCVNLFNIEEESNATLNKSYVKFFNGIQAILRAYGEVSQKIQQKEASGQKVETLTEEVLYFRTSDDAVLALGITHTEPVPGFGKFPSGKIAYLRLLIKGEEMRKMPKSRDDLIKSFSIQGKAVFFKNVPHDYALKNPICTAYLLEGLLLVVESLPQDQFELLNDDSLVGFVKIIQQKANLLLIRNKALTFKRAL